MTDGIASGPASRPAGGALGTEPLRPPPATRELRRSRLRLRAIAARVSRALAVHVPEVAAGLAAAIPMINSTVKAVRDRWVPAGDDGIIATRGWTC